MEPLTLLAPAKLNLTLDVLGKRADGYHDMKMVMISVSLADTVTLAAQPGEGIELTSNLRFLPSDRRNLAVVAALRFQEAAGVDLGRLSIHIEKKIPVCAGTAGGSSDAAAVLRGLDRMMGTHFSPQELAKIGEGVGSDVPYCVMGGTALAEGRGEKLTPLPAFPMCWVVLAKPGFPVSTPELFTQLDSLKLRCRPDTAGMLAALDRGDLPGIARRLFNVFEEALPPRRREMVEELKQKLLDFGALGSGMTGTGPTVFGLFEGEDATREACRGLKESCREVFLAQTLS